MSASDTLVKDQTPRNQYKAAAGQTVFDYTFLIFDETNLVVLQNSTELTLNTDYSVQDVGVEDGGTITLTSGATDGDIITIERDLPIERDTDFAQAGDYHAETVNLEEDKEIMMMQQLERDLSRSLTLLREVEIDSIELPTPEAGKLLGWNAAADDLVNKDGEGQSKFIKENVDLSTDPTLDHGLGTKAFVPAFWDMDTGEYFFPSRLDYNDAEPLNKVDIVGAKTNVRVVFLA